MDGYPAHYVSHNLPFVILFGLGSTDPKPRDVIEDEYPLLQEKGIYISSDLPNVTGPAAEELQSCFHDFDAKDAAWNNRPGKGKMGTTGFTYRNVGRGFTLPPHKAKTPSSMPSPEAEEDLPRRSSLTPVLHSPLSPLSPASPLFPDGIMTHSWFSKHQWLLPSALISLFNFSVDPSSSTLQDNKLKTEINALRTSITASGYKIRVVVVLVCGDDDKESAAMDRVENIRRGTSMDSKSLFFLPAHLSTVEVQAFVATILASIQPSCFDYYRDLSKHARRKRNRSTVPPPTAPPTYGTSQTLSAQGWNVRYETKLGFFAECRQEMDAAGRNYEAAYEFLLDGDVFESIAIWSPRFDEARLLADVLAMRILRCLLWTGQTTSAVQSWSNHRARIQDLIDRKGKGSRTYGWEAWEARWSIVMAELIEKVDVPIFHVPELRNSDGSASAEIPDVYAIPEKAFPAGERLPPWDLLHHEGYWLQRAAQRTRARRKLALSMPKEDRNSPETSPASQIASKSHLYDTYLCPEPHEEYGLPGHTSFDHSALLVQTFRKAAIHFSKRQQRRAVEKMEFEIGREYMRSGRWEEAMVLLRPLWRKLSWRREGWWNLVEEVSWAVRACARHLADGETLVAVEWELLSNLLTSRSNWQYNIHKCLDGLDVEEKPFAIIKYNSTAPCLSAYFAFGATNGRLGEVVTGQLTVVSQAHRSSAALTLSQIDIAFEGGFTGFSIRHDSFSVPVASMSKEPAFLYDVKINKPSLPTGQPSPNSSQFDSVLAEPLESPLDSPSLPGKIRALSGSADLKFPPGARKVFEITILPCDAGQARVAKASLSIREKQFNLDLIIPLREPVSRADWWLRDGTLLTKKKLDVEHTCSVTILPKPPKMRIDLPDLRKAYYADERVDIQIQMVNEEDDNAVVRLEVQLQGIPDTLPAIHWVPTSGTEDDKDQPKQNPSGSGYQPTERSLGLLTPFAMRSEILTFQPLPDVAEYALEIKAHYHLSSDPGTPILKAVTRDLVFIRPFEVKFSFLPRVHPDPWPSYFHYDEDEGTAVTPNGLKQHWSIVTKLASFALEPVLVHAATAKILETRSGASCRLLKDERPETGLVKLSPNNEIDREFDLEILKTSIEDRRSSIVRLQLEVLWSLESTPDRHVTTRISIPQLTVPFGEPRVLATAELSHGELPLVHISYTLENPSVHLLTFQITMEASEAFAFSGPKTGTVQLVPLSRHTVNFNLLPSRRNTWIRPSLKVVDVGFAKTLKVLAALGCIGDMKGLAVWVPE